MRKISLLFFLAALVLAAYWFGQPYLPETSLSSDQLKKTWTELRYGIEKKIDKVTQQDAFPKPTPLEKKDDSYIIAEAIERASEDPALAMEWIQNDIQGPERLEAMLAVIAVWAAEDVETALLWLENNAGGIARLETLNSGMALWSQQAPKAAANWVDTMANDGSKVAAARALADNWGRSDGKTAANWVESIPAGPIKDEAAHSLIEAWIHVNPNKGSMWGLEQSILTENHALMETVLKTLAEKSPEYGVSFLKQLYGVYNTKDAEAVFIQRRSEIDPSSTANWLDSLKPGDPLNSEKNRQTLLQSWALTDSVAASIWLASRPLGQNRDAAINGFIKTMVDFEPEVAVQWSSAISDPTQRIHAITDTVLQWAYTNPVAALNWTNQARIPTEVRTYLVSEIEAN